MSPHGSRTQDLQTDFIDGKIAEHQGES